MSVPDAIRLPEAFTDLTGGTLEALDAIVSDRNLTDDASKLDGIEAGADVTDATNVAAAGALMAANNLSDVADSATARTSIGAASASHEHAASDITSGTFDDSLIAESNVTQHEEALTLVESSPIFISPQDADAVAALNVVDFVVPYDFSLTSVEFHCRESDPPVGSAAQLDALIAGVSIFATNPTIDSGEFSSTTAAIPPVLSSNPTALTAGQRIQFDLDQVGASSAGRGYYVILRGTRTNV
jgi:hypothetical protein